LDPTSSTLHPKVGEDAAGALACDHNFVTVSEMGGGVPGKP